MKWVFIVLRLNVKNLVVFVMKIILFVYKFLLFLKIFWY